MQNSNLGTNRSKDQKEYEKTLKTKSNVKALYKPFTHSLIKSIFSHAQNT